MEPQNRGGFFVSSRPPVLLPGSRGLTGNCGTGTWEDDASDLRRIDPETGEVLDSLEMPPGIGVSGLESDGGDQFFCGGGRSGKVRTVRRPNQRTAASASK